jgi:2-isopropylmalate synthase
MSREIKIYDTPLRDGTRSEGVSPSMEDKVRIVQRLDALGIHYIECGWLGSNQKDLPFFKRAPDAVFKTAKISAFGVTRRPGLPPRVDANIQALVEVGPPVVTIFGKA